MRTCSHAEARLEGGRPEGPARDLRRANAVKILIIDDNLTNRKLLRVALESEKYDVCEATDGVEALAALDREPVAAVISDILMPRMDGYRFCLELRRSPRHQHLPLIMYTNTYLTPGDEKCAIDLGADRCLRKPAPTRVLAGALRELLDRPRPVSAPARPAPGELEVMKEYNQVLIHKLEERNLALEQAQGEISRINHDLEARVSERTAQLESANAELDAFSHSVAHDLRNPLAIIVGYAHLLESAGQDPSGRAGPAHARKISEAAARMEALIADLLKLSLGSRGPLQRQTVDISALASEIVRDLRESAPQRQVEVLIAPGMTAHGDGRLLRIALENLLGNAWKFTGRREEARIEFGLCPNNGTRVWFVSDNGAGFDTTFARKLFQPFQRLHPEAEFPGTGIGLSTVQRIVRRHGGSLWAEGAPGRGATFYFTLKD